jgi:uncharacterized membrane protein YeiH
LYWEPQALKTTNIIPRTQYMDPIHKLHAKLKPGDIPLAISLILNYLATIVFAVSGTRVALATGWSEPTAVLAGVVTANGGGTIRDIVLGHTPFWIYQPGFLIVSVVFAAAALLIKRGAAPGSAMYGVYGYI